jgi:predicted kinase
VGTDSAGAHTGAARGGVLAPGALHDLRGGHDTEWAVGVLTYPATCVLLVTGLPGAGKTTLLARVVTPGEGIAVLDADRVRARWQRRFGPAVPYRVYRPLVRLSHYAEMVVALRGPGAVVVHDSGRNPVVRRVLRYAAGRRGSPVHALLLDVTAHQALSGQRERGRGVSIPVFARHHREWRRLLSRLTPWLEANPARAAAPGGFASCVLVDRPAAQALTDIVFTAPEPVPRGHALPGQARRQPVTKL